MPAMLRKAALASRSVSRACAGTHRATASRPAIESSVLPPTMTKACATVLSVSSDRASPLRRRRARGQRSGRGEIRLGRCAGQDRLDELVECLGDPAVAAALDAHAILHPAELRDEREPLMARIGRRASGDRLALRGAELARVGAYE